MMGLGRGKPMAGAAGEEPQARFGDANFGGMGRGRRLAPPPGIGSSAGRSHRTPGGLSKEWRPEPPIPEEELDPEHQDSNAPNGYWGSNMELPSRLLLAASTAAACFGNDDDVWSKASYCGTPSMAWSKTPSPPGTPLLLSRGIPDWQQPAMPLGSFADYNLPSGSGGLPGNVAHGLHNPHGVVPIPMYVTVPVSMTHSCPHCGRAFALAPDAAAAAVGPQGRPASMQTPPSPSARPAHSPQSATANTLAAALTAAMASPQGVPRPLHAGGDGSGDDRQESSD